MFFKRANPVEQLLNFGNASVSHFFQNFDPIDGF